MFVEKASTRDASSNMEVKLMDFLYTPFFSFLYFKFFLLLCFLIFFSFFSVAPFNWILQVFWFLIAI